MRKKKNLRPIYRIDYQLKRYLIVETDLSINGNTEWCQRKKNAQPCGHDQNMLQNLWVQLIKFIDQQKVAKQVANSWNNYNVAKSLNPFKRY